MPRCGDHVHHEPSGENWLVAWADDGKLAPAGWPPTVAQLADCRVIRRCSDEEHARAVDLWRRATNSNHRGKVLALYGVAGE